MNQKIEELDLLLASLKLGSIRQNLPGALDRAREGRPSYSDFLLELLKQEQNDKVERQLEYRIKQAKLPERWPLESYPFELQPTVDKTQINQLGELDFLKGARNLVFMGPTGVGKTGLASGILLKALENGHRGLFIKAQDLFDEMYASLADRSTRRLINRLMNIELLLIDEMGYLNLRPEQTNAFFKLMDARHRQRTTLITTNLEYDQWFSFLGRKQMVEALLDRLKQNCTTIRIEGRSLRAPLN